MREIRYIRGHCMQKSVRLPCVEERGQEGDIYLQHLVRVNFVRKKQKKEELRRFII